MSGRFLMAATALLTGPKDAPLLAAPSVGRLASEISISNNTARP